MSVKRYYVDIFPYTIQEGDCTIVSTSIAVYNQNEEVVYEASFSGSSVRNPVDKPNADAGALIALGRALSKAGKRLDVVGNGLNKHDDDVKAERAKQAEKKKTRSALNEVTRLGQEMGGYDIPEEQLPPAPKDDDVYN